MSNPIYKLGSTSYSIIRDLSNNDKTLFRNNNIDVIELSGITSENAININHENPIIDIRSINTGITSASTLNLGIANSTNVWNISAGISGTAADPGYNLHIGKNNVEFITILDNGNVGIGNTQPDYKLSISDSAEVIGDFFVSGNIFISGVTGFADVKNIWYDDGSNNILSTAFSGNYGIGTTTPSNKFEVIGGIGVSGDIVPLLDNTFDLGSTGVRFRDLFLAPGTLHIGDVIMSSSANLLSVTGSMEIDTDLNVGGNLEVTGSIDLTGDVQVNSIGVTTDATITGNSVMSGTLGVTGNVTAENDLSIVGNSIMTGTLGVTGSGTFENDLSVVGNSTMNGTLGVTGTITAENALDVTGIFTGTTGSFSDDFSVATSDLIVDTTNGFVGIGIASPLTSLHISSTDALVIPVGTTSQRVDVQGGIRYNTQLSSFEGYSGSSWGSLGGLSDIDGDTFISAEDSPGSNNDELKFTTGGTQQMIIDSSGNVGIGTIDPSALLHLETPMTETGGMIELLRLAWNDSGVVNQDVGDGTKISFHTSSVNNSLGTTEGAFISSYKSGGGESDVATQLRFGTNNGTVVNTVMVIDDAGFVGIGSEDPVKHLEVVGATNTDGDMAIRSGSQNNNSTLFLGTPFTTASVNKTAIIADAAASWSKADLHFCVNGDNNTTEVSLTDSKMMISGDGFLGIGIATPVRLLHIHEATAATDAIIHLTNDVSGSGTGNGFDIIVDTGGNVELRNRENTEMQFFINNSEKFAITTGGNFVRQSGGYILGKQIFGSIGFETGTGDGSSNENISGNQTLYLNFTRTDNGGGPPIFFFNRNFNHVNGFDDSEVQTGSGSPAPNTMQRLEVNTTGLYLVTYFVNIDGISTTAAVITTEIELNGGGQYGAQSSHTGSGTTMSLSGSAIINATSSQYFTVKLTIDTGNCDVNGGRLDALLVSTTI